MSRLALCFAGLPRITDTSTASWRRLMAQHDTDVFVHAWSDQPELARNWISSTYAPTEMIVESQRDFDTSIYTDRIWAYRSQPRNVLSMWYSIGQSLQLADKHAWKQRKTYDYVARARFDWHCDQFVLEPFEGLTVPDDPGLGGHNFQHRGQWHVAHNDQFGYGSMSVMRDYGETYSRIPWLYTVDGIDFCSELFLTTNMMTKRIPVKLQKGMRYRMVRD
jgi:hypothetical protein